MHGSIGTFVRSRFLTAAAVVIAASGVVVGGTAVAANAVEVGDLSIAFARHGVETIEGNGAG